MELKNIVFQIIRDCENECGDCFLGSRPGLHEMLAPVSVTSGLEDLHALTVSEFIFTGGEPTIWPNLQSIIAKARTLYPSTRIRIDTNGIGFYTRPGLFDLQADTYHISIDPFHEHGLTTSIRKGVLDERLRGLYVDSRGASRLLEYMLKKEEELGFALAVRWTSNRCDTALFEAFYERYHDRVEIIRKEVTATGNARALPVSVTGPGFLIEEDPKRFTCLMGSSLILAIDGWWYACYHPVAHTRITRPGDPSFGFRCREITSSALYGDLPAKGIAEVLKQVAITWPEKKPLVDSLLRRRFWYRCEPCIAATECGVFGEYETRGGT